MAITPGQAIGQYIIQSKLGEGGMGAVYKADQPAIHRAVALKVLSANLTSDPEALGRFKREVDIIAELEHPYILPLYDFGQVDDNPYIVMRYMGRGSLYELLRERRLSQPELLRVLRQVAEALDYAHARDVIHRDLKPGNVLLDESGNACLADFGLAKTMAGSRDLTTTGSILGTPAYMSPEQARGDRLDARSDIYSFAVMVYEALSGQLPFHAKTSMEYIQKHLTEAPPSIVTVAPRLPPAVGEVLRRGMAKERAQRPARATELMDALEAALAGGSAAVPAANPVPERTVAGGPRTGTLAGRAALGQAPGAATPAAVPSAGAAPRRSGLVWVAVGAGVLVLGAIVVLALAGGGILASNVVRVDQLPVALALSANGKALWVASALNNTLARVDLANGHVTSQYHLPNVPTAMLLVGNDLWIANSFAGTVTRVGPEGAVLGDYQAGHNPVALAYDGHSLWVASQDTGNLNQLDPANGAILHTYPVGGQPAALAFDGAHVWAALSDKNEVAELDPANGIVLARVAVGQKPVSVFYDGATLWSADQTGNTVSRIDVSKRQKLTTIAVPGGPYALAWAPCGTGCGDLWVADEAANNVSRVRLAGP
jgi:DNA-binding beta-propeller fold protein YncE